MSKWKTHAWPLDCVEHYRHERNELADLLEAYSIPMNTGEWVRQRNALLDRLRVEEKAIVDNQTMTLHNGDTVMASGIDEAVVIDSANNERLGVRMVPQHAPKQPTVREKVDRMEEMFWWQI